MKGNLTTFTKNGTYEYTVTGCGNSQIDQDNCISSAPLTLTIEYLMLYTSSATGLSAIDSSTEVPINELITQIEEQLIDNFDEDSECYGIDVNLESMTESLENCLQQLEKLQESKLSDLEWQRKANESALVPYE